MADINYQDLWFNTLDPKTLCRMGGNGPDHPSHLYELIHHARPYDSILDIGCGSGCTLEALLKYKELVLDYMGVDMLPKNIKYCNDNFQGFMFMVQNAEKLEFADKSFNIAYSRHVVDHMPSFEAALEEHCRVAKRLVIIVLWVPLSDAEEHSIKNIEMDGKVYEKEYTNQYSKKRVKEALEQKQKEGWFTHMIEEVGKEVQGHNTTIVLERR